jgi:hypothetical protein
MAMVGAGCVALSFLSRESGYALPGLALLAVGVGLGLITGPIATVAVANAPAGRSGMSSGLVNMGRLIGATLGVEILGLLFGAGTGNVARDPAAFLHGQRLSFVLGACVELLGALIAAAWLRADSLGGRDSAGRSSDNAPATAPWRQSAS